MEFKRNCFYADLHASSKEEVLKLMSDGLLKNNIVNEFYYDKVMEREKLYPTGIQASVGFAIPHTDPDYVIKDAISIAVLKEPVMFQEMGDREISVPVKFVFLLAFTKGEKHLEILQKVVALVSDKDSLEKLLNNDEEYQYNFFKQYFDKN